MKKLLSTLCAMLMLASVAEAQGWSRQPTPNDTLRSTVILPNNDVVFQIYAPQAEKVAVMGDLPWDKPAVFRKEENGVWKGRMAGLTDGVYRYRFMVDGVTARGLVNGRRCPLRRSGRDGVGTCSDGTKPNLSLPSRCRI